MSGDLARVTSFVPGGLFKADGIGIDGVGTEILHQGNHQRRVNPAGQERPQWYIGHHLRTHCGHEHLLKRIDSLGIARKRQGLLKTFMRRLPCRPIGHRGWQCPLFQIGRRNRHKMARHQFADTRIDTVWRGDVVVTHHQRQGITVETGIKARHRAQRLKFRGKRKGITNMPPIQGLFTHAITRQRQGARFAIPQGERIHAHQRLQRGFQAPCRNDGQQRFSIRVPPPVGRVALNLQQLAQIKVVVDFAVERYDIAATRRNHRLMAGFGEVDNGQTHMRQPDTRFSVFPKTLAVRATMP